MHRETNMRTLVTRIAILSVATLIVFGCNRGNGDTDGELLVGAAAWLGLSKYAFERMDVVFLVVCFAGLGLLGLSIV